MASEREGPCLQFVTFVTNLPIESEARWMTPCAGVKTTPAFETRLPGLPSQREPQFFENASCVKSSSVIRCLKPKAKLVDFADYGDAGLAEDMGDLRVA